ncbi:MAG: hydrogenase iron-sulfur subunit [Candidatus Eremiobacterota bacterium]
MEDKSTKSDWEPRIVGFVCNWCTYAGADLAGTSRLKYPPNVRLIRLPCTGAIDPLFIVKAFQSGADAVLVSGCHPADCHYTSGNYHARRKLTVFRDLLQYTGLDPNRFWMSWISASEGQKFASFMEEIVAETKKLGPLKGYNN